MDEDHYSSASDSEPEEPRQAWQFKKLWTTSLDSAMSNRNSTCKELVRRIVAQAGVDVKILDDLQAPAICFKPEKAKATMDETGKRVQIVGVMFKPGMEGFEGKRWRLIAENSLYSYMLPMMLCKFEEKLPYEQVYIVLNGAVDESSHQIRLDQDYRKTVVIAVTSGPLGKAERAAHQVLSFNFKLSWSNSTKCRELTVEPLLPGLEDLLLYWNYLPSLNQRRQGATTEKIRKYLQQEVVQGSLKELELDLQHRADGDGCDTVTGDAGSNEGLRGSVDQMEANQNEGQHQKPSRKNKTGIAIPPQVEENATGGGRSASDNVPANAKEQAGKSCTQTASSFSNDERRVPAANRVTLFEPTASPDIPEPVTIKKRPGPRSKTTIIQPKQAKISTAALPDQENTIRLVMQPPSKAPVVQSNNYTSKAKTVTDQEVPRKPDFADRTEKTDRITTKPMQAEKMKDPQDHALSKESQKIRKNASVYGFDSSPLDDTTGVHESSPESLVQRNPRKRLNLDVSDFNDNNIVVSQTTSKEGDTAFVGKIPKDNKMKTYTISVATESSSESTTVSREPSEERNVSQHSKSSGSSSVVSAVRAVATAVIASDNDKSSSSFTAVKRSTLCVSSNLSQQTSSSAAIAEVPEDDAGGEQAQQTHANGTDCEGPPKVSNRKIDRKQDENKDQPAVKKRKASENIESKYRYDSLRKLSNKLAGDVNAVLQKRNIYAVVEQVLQVGAADKKGYCRDMKEGTYIVRIGTKKKSGVLTRICPMKYNPDQLTEQMKLGPSMKIGDVIRIHRATVQFELQYGENQMVISTSPHHNYALFDGSKDNDEMGRRGLAQNPTPLNEEDKGAIKKLWEYWSSTINMEPEVVEGSLSDVTHDPMISPSKAAKGVESGSNAPVSPAKNNATCSPRPRRSPRKLASPPGRIHVVHEKNSQDVPESQATFIDADPAANIRDSDVEEEPMITDVQEVNDLLTSDEDTVLMPLQEGQNEDVSKRRKAFSSAKVLHVRTKLPLRTSGSYIVNHANAFKEISVMRLKDMDFERDGLSYNLFGKVENFRISSHEGTFIMYIDFTDKTNSEYDFLTHNDKDEERSEGYAETVQIEVLMKKHERALAQEFLMKSAVPTLLMNVRRIPTTNISKLQTTISNIVFVESLP